MCKITRASIDVNQQSARRSLNGVVYIILYLPDENWDHYRQVVGKSQAVTLDVTDMNKTAADLKAKGVKFVQEPDAQPWGTHATIEDSEGNHILLVEQPAGH